MTSHELIQEISKLDFKIYQDFYRQLGSLSDVKDVLKRFKKSPSRLEKIAVVCKAMEIHSRHKIRDVQILAVLMMYHPQVSGRLSEIGTGEGKTIIIAMLAALFGLEKRKVDIGM